MMAYKVIIIFETEVILGFCPYNSREARLVRWPRKGEGFRIYYDATFDLFKLVAMVRL
jgi:hypothetical protein